MNSNENSMTVMYSESIRSEKTIASLRVVGSGGTFALEVANYGETELEKYKPQTLIVSRDDLQIIKQLIENLQSDESKSRPNLQT